MRLLRSLPVIAAAALALAGCGGQSGPTAAENNALHAIAHAQKVLSYPIAAKPLLRYLPSSVSSSLGSPVYLFAVSVKGAKQPTWVLAGQQSSRALHLYKNIAALAAHASQFGLSSSAAAALHVIAAAKSGTVALPVMGVRVHSATQAQLKKIGVAVGSGSYTVVSLLSPPPALHASSAAVANFVESNGTVVSEYGTNK